VKTVDPEAAVERLWPDRGAHAVPLSGGITNHNFKVDVRGETFVLRMGGAQTGLLGIDRRVEHEASLRAAEVGLGPEVAGFLEEEGWLVTRFIDGRPIPPKEMRRPETIRRVAHRRPETFVTEVAPKLSLDAACVNAGVWGG
jgi:thiamine kinase-like enzyme